MTYLYLLAGENLKLAEAELNGFLKSQENQETPERRERLAETGVEPDRINRLALTHEVAKKIETVTNPEDVSYNPQTSFAVRTEELQGEHETEKITEKIGGQMETKENSVDLENPEEVIKAYLFEDEIIIGKIVQDIQRGLFNGRTNEKRPFSSPISLDPVIGRILVNLSEVSAGEKILDPFCGTGGILIEAGLCGILPLGTDIKKEMVEGTRKNLEEYGIINHEIKQGDAENSLDSLNYSINAIITDLPYGKASKVEGEIEEKFLNLIREFQGKVVFMYDKPELGDFEADFEIYMHKNLTRYIFTI